MTVATAVLDLVTASLEKLAKPFGEVVTLLLTVDRRVPKVENMILGTMIIRDTRWEGQPYTRHIDQYIVWSVYAQEDGTRVMTNGRGPKGGYHLTWSEAVETAKFTQV